MGTKTISVTDTAYHRLVQEKRAGESFTDVILRLTGKGSLRDLAGLVSKVEADALAEAVASGRRERRTRRARRIGEAP